MSLKNQTQMVVNCSNNTGKPLLDQKLKTLPPTPKVPLHSGCRRVLVQDDSNCWSVKNPWLLRVAAAFSLAITIIVFAALYNKLRTSVQTSSLEVQRLQRILMNVNQRINELESSLQSARSENGTDNRGRLCWKVGRSNRKGEKDPKPKDQVSRKDCQNEGNIVNPSDGSKRKPSRRSTVFVRWGTTQCRTSNKSHTSLVYAGRVASSHYRNKGGGSNYLCMPDRAFYTNRKNISNTDRAFLYPVKYGRVMTIFTKFTPAILRLLPPDKLKLIKPPLDSKDVPCAVCRVDGATAALMIPAHNYCPPKWNRQYHGYLMSQKHNYEKSEFVCVDVEAEGIPNTQNSNGEAFLHLTEYNCGSSRCPGYQRNKALTCAVCTT